jgi:hypothetical protein
MMKKILVVIRNLVVQVVIIKEDTHPRL